MTPPNQYAFVTTFSLRAPVEKVWDALADVQSWPAWWKPLKRVTLDHVSYPQVATFTLGSLFYTLTYTLTTTHIEEYVVSTFDSSGELTGDGSFRYRQEGDITSVVFTWNVTTTKGWMNATAPILRPVFVRAHGFVMRAFAKGLGKYIHAKVMSVKNDCE